MADPAKASTAIATSQTDAQVFRRKIVGRGFRALNYLSIYAFIFIVYGGAVFTDYALFSLVWWLLGEEVQKYPLIATATDYAKIGLALLSVATALIHGLLSTYSQVKLDLALMREEEK